MIVVAIIAIIAAIAIPQFNAYRLRTFNASAKSVIKNIVANQANLNAELGCFGETEGNQNTLIALIGPPGDGVENDTFNNHFLIPASAAGSAGSRLAGNNASSGMTFSVPLDLGANMVAMTNTPASIANSNTATSFMAFTRHINGDTAYGFDSDLTTNLYSVSNPNWPGKPGLRATTVDVGGNGPVSGVNGFDLDNQTNTQGDNMSGGGLPSPNWSFTQW